MTARALSLLYLSLPFIACSQESQNDSVAIESELEVTAGFPGPGAPPKRVANGECWLPLSVDASYRQLCRRCAADADMPGNRIDYRRQAEVVSGRYRLPPKQTWHRELTPRALFGSTPPVFWRDLDAEEGLATCERAIKAGTPETDRVSYGRMLHKAGKVEDAAHQFELEYTALKGRTTSGIKASATYLARMYQTGQGVRQDLRRAADLYEEAATDTLSTDGEMFWPAHSRAQHNLASMYFWGRGVDKDARKAAELWGAASRNHQVHSTANLAWMYRRGEGVARDLDRSAELYLSAARRLSLREDAPDLLISNEDRFGRQEVEGDFPLEWLRSAARSEQREVLLTLAFLYHTGQAVPGDLELALDFYERGVRLYGLSPEYSPGPAFIDTWDAPVPQEQPAWAIARPLLDAGVESSNPLALAIRGIYLERVAEASDYRPDIVEAARQAYEASGLPNAAHRAAKLLLYQSSLSQGNGTERAVVLERARELLIDAAQNGNPSAQLDLAAVLNMTGALNETNLWVQKSVKVVRGDFYYPDVRPLLVGGMLLDALDGAENSADAVFLFEEAERRAVYRGRIDLIDTIREARRLAQENYRAEMMRLSQQREAEEHVRNALTLAVVFLVLSGMGGGVADAPGQRYMDMTDPMQFWGANIIMSIR